MFTQPVEFDTSRKSTLGCGAIIKNAYFPANNEELSQICLQLSNKKPIILGGLSNCLVMEDVDCAICLSKLKGIKMEEGYLVASAGENLGHLAHFAGLLGLSGLENMVGIPGTLGGAVYGNSGSFGTTIADVIESVQIYNRRINKLEVYKRSEIGFFDRHTTFNKDMDIITKVMFNLKTDNPPTILDKMDVVIQKRKTSQPNKPSLGSVFRKYNNQSAGYYIDKIGLKGTKIGGMKISETHANFIINTNNGTPQDYYKLMCYIQEEVYKQLGIKLVREVRVIGEHNI